MIVSLRSPTDGAADRALHVRVFACTRADLGRLPLPTLERDLLMKLELGVRDRAYEASFGHAGHAIVTADDVDVGEIWVHRTHDALRLVDIALLPEHRNVGSGTWLIEQLIEEARKKNLPLRLSVVTMSRARRLYERLGFRLVVDDAGDFGEQIYQEMELLGVTSHTNPQ